MLLKLSEFGPQRANHPFCDWLSWRLTTRLSRGSFDFLQISIRQENLRRLEILLKMSNRRGPRNRQHDGGAVQQPCDRELRDRRAVAFCNRVQLSAGLGQLASCH